MDHESESILTDAEKDIFVVALIPDFAVLQVQAIVS